MKIASVRRITFALLLGSALGPAGVAPAEPAASRALTFQQRVAAQEAIERVYYTHQIGATLPFEEAVPRDRIERKVRSHLKLSLALERHLGTPITAAMLQRETERIASATRMPGRLRELFAALGNDPFLVQEILVRPVLAERLVQARLGPDGAKRGWKEWLKGLGAAIDESEALPAASVSATLPSPAQGCTPDDTWSNGSLDDPQVIPRREHTAVWTGSLMLVWSGWGDLSGERYDPATDTWAPISTQGAPEQRIRSTAIWTGNEMIVWGGVSGLTGARLSSGGLYNPQTDTWLPMALQSPSPREGHVAVWTGSRMIVWGGLTNSAYTNTGGRYDPVRNEWDPIDGTGAPAPREDAVAVWAGGRVVVFGGYGGVVPLGSGGRYDPAFDRWEPMSSNGEPEARRGHTGISTGATMIVWGGTGASGGVELDSGGRYDLATDTWLPTRLNGAPEARTDHTAIWTGSEMIVWGGLGGAAARLSSGGRYNPVSDSWSSTTQAAAPSPRANHSAVWTGSEMIVWAGTVNSGGRYAPATDSWRPTLVDLTPSGRANHTAVWTGNEMIVWGGNESTHSFPDAVTATGARYDPALDSWRSTAWADAPAAREGHTAVWTGQGMIVWGGTNGLEYLDSGGRYDPIADSWGPTSPTQAPLGRTGHTAVWTGAEMIVWGGTLGNAGLDTGSRYDPVTDQWRATRRTGAAVPAPRFGHTAVWSGSQMLIWGGSSAGADVATGGRYDPVSDSWSSMTVNGAPQASSEHTAVWTGLEMIVWGQGYVQPQPGAGGRYDPASDSWTPTSLQNAPAARNGHSAIWTGLEMIVWGGVNNQYRNDGALYDPGNDAWSPTTSAGAPAPRADHTAVWTGSTMIVVGGRGTGGWGTGGQYSSGVVRDGDGDGHLTFCDDDCDDANPAIYAGAPQVCGDGLNNDCRHPSWPALAGTNEVDDDADTLAECQGDCDDARAAVGPGFPQVCGDHVNNDCLDPAWPAPPPDDADTDGDSIAICQGDCSDTRGDVYPGAPQLCDGVNNDCLDPAWPTMPAGEEDEDDDTFRLCMGDCDDTNFNVRPGWPQLCGDGLNNDCLDPAWPAPPGDDLDPDGDGWSSCEGDCAEGNPNVRPGGPQVCDGLNNDCSHPSWPGLSFTNESDDDGDGLSECGGDCDDLLWAAWGRPSEVLDLTFAADGVTLAWSPPQVPGGNTVCYRVARASDPGGFGTFASCVEPGDCSDAVAVDTEIPIFLFSYLVRAQTLCSGTTGVGTWGTDSAGTERLVAGCP